MATPNWTGAPTAHEPLGVATLRMMRPRYTVTRLSCVAFSARSKRIAPYAHVVKGPVRDTARCVDEWSDRWATHYTFTNPKFRRKR